MTLCGRRAGGDYDHTPSQSMKHCLYLQVCAEWYPEKLIKLLLARMGVGVGGGVPFWLSCLLEPTEKYLVLGYQKSTGAAESHFPMHIAEKGQQLGCLPREKGVILQDCQTAQYDHVVSTCLMRGPLCIISG